VIFPFFAHPYDQFENAMSWEKNVCLSTCGGPQSEAGLVVNVCDFCCGSYNGNGRFCQQECAAATYRENIGFSFTEERKWQPPRNFLTRV
jgi:hypothetical protein